MHTNYSRVAHNLTIALSLRVTLAHARRPPPPLRTPHAVRTRRSRERSGRRESSGSNAVSVLCGRIRRRIRSIGRIRKFSDWRPQLVPSLQSIGLIQVACGAYHSSALNGDLLEAKVC